MQNNPVTMYQGKKFRIEEFTDTNGLERERVVRMPSVSVIPILPNGNLIINKEKRRTLSDYIYNLPSGILDKESDPIEGARRELREETGYDSKNFELFMREIPKSSLVYPLYLYIARDLHKDQDTLQMDDDEEIDVVEMSLTEVYELALQNKIYVEFNAYAIMRFYELVRRGEIQLR